MSPQLAFGVSVVFALVLWGFVAQRYVWPRLRDRPLADALRPLALLHAFRFIGLAFVVPGVVSPDLPAAFARPAAYGDLATAILAALALTTLRTRLGIVLVWAFNVLGVADLLNAYYLGNRTGVGSAPGLQGAAYFIPAVIVPLLLVTHGLAFRLLLRREAVVAPRPSEQAA